MVIDRVDGKVPNEFVIPTPPAPKPEEIVGRNRNWPITRNTLSETTMGNINNLKPFQSGFDPRRNLNGRPAGRSMRSQFEEILSRKLPNDKTIADALVEKIIKMALDGDQQMIKLIWEYRDGKPPKYRGNPEPERPPKRKLSEEEIKRVDELFAPKPWSEDERS